MAIAEDIKNALKSIVETELPDYREAKNVFEVERNPNVNLSKRYGVRSLGAVQSIDVPVQFLGYDHDFEILIVDLYKNLKKDDQKQQDIAMRQINAMEQIAAKIHSTKAGLPSKVMNIEFTDYSETEFFEDQNLAVLRATFTIKYKIRIGC